MWLQGGKSTRIVNCVLALKEYSEWKDGGKQGSWKPGGNTKPPFMGKSFLRKNSESSINPLSRTLSDNGWTNDQSTCSESGHDRHEGVRDHTPLICPLIYHHLLPMCVQHVPICMNLIC